MNIWHMWSISQIDAVWNYTKLFIIFTKDKKDKKAEKEGEQNDEHEEDEDGEKDEEGKGTASRATTRSASRMEAER